MEGRGRGYRTVLGAVVRWLAGVRRFFPKARRFLSGGGGGGSQEMPLPDFLQGKNRYIAYLE